MSVALELLSVKSRNPNSLKTDVSSSSVALRALPSMRFQSLLRPSGCRVSLASRRVFTPRDPGSPSLSRGCSLNRSVSLVALAASHEESKHSDVELEKEGDDDLGAEESPEAWKEALISFQEQVLRLQCLSREAYEVHSKKAIEILKETSEQLKIQADKARSDLGVIAKEFTEEGKEYLSTVAVNSPEPVKEIFETYSSSAHDISHFSSARDFHVGIPYGFLLSLGGFLSFMITGSVSAIRFGVILGGVLLALSVSSLRSHNKGERFPLALKGQTAIAAIIFLREMCLQSQRPTVLKFLTTFVSGVVVAFYLYKITINGKKRRSSDLEPGAEN
ncbi:protein FATTY ACID EXPORT 3, chloroplastic isoform X1 [Carica papaya]|uniref:protein FATTY ACID EXPORT 3, chloroplastic isoform X1 n=1 Tax=Carica papaya TaxID=3649 RepID=UPI000B8CB5C4|nr:protein FATTY ACID EXPORT 3, chloroplastic isoform X1 [Carica papaya]XP_021910625.1 protein FATTY ACID EXPORT 3, chloroplastic isoform X1 [Carica papaya]